MRNAVGMERECGGETSRKAAYHPDRLYEHSPAGDVAGIPDPTDHARRHTYADSVDSPGVLRGGSKCDAAVAVKPDASICDVFEAATTSLLWFYGVMTVYGCAAL